MVKGINAYDNKNRRKIRIRNHIARDLADSKYRQRVKNGRPKAPPPEIDDWNDELNDDA